MNAPDYLALLKAENEKKTRLPGTDKTDKSLLAVLSVTPRAEKNHISCSTCAHVCRSGCCGEPVAAGLSDLPGVICYHPDQGATCPAWLARLDPDLERRILAMGECWGYSGDDLAIALEGARQDPEGWRRVVEAERQAIAIVGRVRS